MNMDKDKEIEIFKNEEFGQVRTVLIENEPWFVGKDVTEILGYQNGSRDINRHVDEEDRQNYQNGTLESNRGLTVINESGLYSLILSSKLPNAKKFKKWVTSEVLPTIRKHGAYMTENTLEEALTNPDFLIKLATELKEEQSKRKALEEEKKLNAPKVIFADAVSTSKTSILIGELAKILKQNGIETGQRRLFEWLRVNKYLISRKGTDYNMPTQKSMELGLFDIKESVHLDSNGVNVITKTPKVTGKGQQYFINKFLNKEV
jgi:anti-repressor protein